MQNGNFKFDFNCLGKLKSEMLKVKNAVELLFAILSQGRSGL